VTTSTPLPEFLPRDTRIGLVPVGPTWSALSVPSSWGPHVLDVLGDLSGPVFHEPARLRLVWILPAGGTADWPDVSQARVIPYGPGDDLLIPCPDGYHDGTAWVRSPLEPPHVTDPELLRGAIEFVFGPLDQAAGLRPLVVCQFCQAPTREGRVTEEFIGPSGPLYTSHACPRCWDLTVAGREGRHLRVVRGAPP
jgi:hypothetical protein